jgi:arsenate reductase (glutaredoxin)
MTSKATIYHNPDCGTSRNTLAILRQSGADVTVIEYLKTPPDRATLQNLIAAMGSTARATLRTNVPPYDTLGLANPDLTDDAILDAMLAQPILINRPIVVTRNGTNLCRPCERVLDLLDDPAIGPFTKEDGVIVIDADGRRVIDANGRAVL